MTYSADAGYWQADADACKQYADEGACLARIARRVPVTIVPGFGLGQVSAVVSFAARSPELVALQTALMRAGALTIRTADGLISSDSSPTLAAVRAWAVSNGLSATGTRRTAGGGLEIPAMLAAAIGASAAPAAGSSTAAKAPAAPASASLPDFTSETPYSVPTWLPWAVGGALALAVGAVVVRRRA